MKIFETKRCNWCSKERPAFRVHTLASRQNMCDVCLEWHIHAGDVLAGAVPNGCQECGITWRALSDLTPGAEVRMYVVPKDGLLAVLCRTCVEPYTTKRADLYRGTEFGKHLNL
jgi:hypothetical protein